MVDGARPPAKRWLVSWWVDSGGHGTAGTMVFLDESMARVKARDWSSKVKGWPRGTVRVEAQTRSVAQVRGERGDRWACGPWLEDDVTSWAHDVRPEREVA